MWACADAGEVFKRDVGPDDVEGIHIIYRSDALHDESRFEPRGDFCREDCGCRIAHGGDEAPARWLVLFGVVLLWRRRSKSR